MFAVFERLLMFSIQTSDLRDYADSILAFRIRFFLCLFSVNLCKYWSEEEC